MYDKLWTSPDGRITKEVITDGIFGLKPSENCVCTIELTNAEFTSQKIPSEYLAEAGPLVVTIGEANTALDRELDKCIETMHAKELCRVKIQLDSEFRCDLKLCSFESRGFIYEWDAKEKVRLAQNHKEKGVELFKANRVVDASHRFSRGLKLLLSVPIPVEDTPKEVDEVQLSELDSFKANLYNNLASCYFKEKWFDIVIQQCSKVLEIEEVNVKALHKRGFAYAETRNFEKARDDLMKVVELDEDNKAARDKLQFVNAQISQQEASFASMVKKMFKT